MNNDKIYDNDIMLAMILGYLDLIESDKFNANQGMLSVYLKLCSNILVHMTDEQKRFEATVKKLGKKL